jgi:hypothetical protein
LAPAPVVSTALGVLALAAGCFQPREDAPPSDALRAPTGLFGGDGGGPPPTDGGSNLCPGGDPSPLSTMAISVRTTAYGGRYAPRNVGAIWIEKSDGTFVKTVQRWAGSRARYLTHFVNEAHTNLVDAVTSATLQSHQTHSQTWNLTGVDRCEVPSGDYKILFETTDYDGTGAYFAVPFTKGQSPATITSPDATNFHEIKLTLQ